MPPSRKMLGERFGRLTVMEFVGRIERSGTRFKQWRCRCDCGNEVTAITGSLTSGNTLSCGCYKLEETAKRLRKHGGHGTPEYVVWQGMLQRCKNPADSAYKEYGGRGISVCKDWREFARFFADMGPRPSPSHSIERRDNSRGYEPRNCVWARREDQNRNQRRRRDNSSGVTGVIWNDARGKWEAFIGHRGRRVYIGLFDDIGAAAAARKAKADELGFNPDHGGSL